MSETEYSSGRFIRYRIKDPVKRRPRGKKFILFVYDYYGDKDQGLFHSVYFHYPGNNRIGHKEGLRMINEGYKVWVVHDIPKEFEN